MGTLVAYRYPTSLALGLADHTYVACGTLGKAWGCWGGKSDGTELIRATGSTLRADAIAEPDERAGVTCFLVNGVCHQASNRILSPSGAIVEAARGYWLSSALFNVYGRPRGILGMCRAPFKRHADVTGDLQECMAGPPSGGGKGSGASDRDERIAKSEQTYLSRSQRLHEQWDERQGVNGAVDEIIDFQMAQFALFVRYRLGQGVSPEKVVEEKTYHVLMQIRDDTERERLKTEQKFVDSGSVEGFRRDDDALTLRFQQRVGEVLGGEQYVALLGLEKGDDLTLADPEIMENAYRRRPKPGP